MDYEDKTVLVLSGTADSGEATVRKVDELGGTVGFTYNAGGDHADDILAALDGDDHQSWNCDVTDREDVASFVDEAFDAFGSVDAIVYNVGVISRSPLTELDPETWQNHLDTNLTGAFNVLGEVGPRLEDQGHGAFVGLAASDGIVRSSNLSAYDASKRGLIALVQETARELGPSGVRANIVAPGFIRDPEALSEDDTQDLLDQQPYKELTTPEAIADAALFLCSDDAATITGAVVPVDSGLALS